MVADESWIDLRMLVKEVKEKMTEEQVDLRMARKSFEDELIAIVLERLHGNRKIASKVLGITPRRISRSPVRMGRINHHFAS